MDMKEKLHIAGCIAYDEVLTPQLKRTAMQTFMAMDTNQDGSVSLQELSADCDSSLQGFVHKMFRLLDADNSGSLDFDECKALFFLALCNATWGTSAWRSCDSCGDTVLDFVYTCSDCVSQRNVYFDLCSDCYPAGIRSHVPSHRYQFQRHDLKAAGLIDTIVTQALEEMPTPTRNVSTTTHNHYYITTNDTQYGSSRAITTSRGELVRTNTRRLTQAVGFVSNIASLVSACSIM